jgi:hypothetical protein
MRKDFAVMPKRRIAEPKVQCSVGLATSPQPHAKGDDRDHNDQPDKHDAGWIARTARGARVTLDGPDR